MYHEQQKLPDRKVLQFTALHPNIGKTFAASALSVLKVLKKAIAKKIFVGKTYVIHRKSAKTTKIFSHELLSFMVRISCT